MKLAVPDMISNSYFPAIAAIELGCFKQEGLDISLELIYPVDKCYAALRDGTVDFVGGSAHSALSAFPRWHGAKLLCAQGQGMYWFLVMHRDLGGKRGDLDVVKGHSIGAAPWVDMGLRRLLIEAGIDLSRDQVKIAPVPGAQGRGRPQAFSAVRGRAYHRAHSPGPSLLRSLDLAKLRRRHEPVLARRRHPRERRALREHRGDAVFAFVESRIGDRRSGGEL